MMKRLKLTYVLALSIVATLCFLIFASFGFSPIKTKADGDVFTVNGAYFRLPNQAENFYGIRFEFGISKQAQEDLASQGEVYYGMEIYAKGDDIPQEVSTSSIDPVVNEDGSGYIQGSLIKIKKENLTRPFSAKAYYKINDGEKQYSEQTSEISIFTMATMALASGNYTAYEETLNGIIDPVLDITANGHYVKNEFKVSAPDGKTLTTLSNGDVITVNSTLKNSVNGNVLPVAVDLAITNADGSEMRAENALVRVEGTLNQYKVLFAFPCEYKITLSLGDITEEFDAKVVIPEGNLLVTDVTEGGYAQVASSQDLIKNVDYSLEDNALKIKAHTGTTGRFTSFKLNFSQGLDLTSHVGVKIMFKVLSHPFGDNADLSFSLQGDAWSQGGGGDVDYGEQVAVGEWGVLTLANADVDAYFNAGDTAISVCVKRLGSTGTSANGDVELLIGDIFYYDVLSTPVNVALTENVLSWDMVDNATGYVVKFNGVEQTAVTTNSCNIADLISQTSGEYIVSVKAIGDGERYIDSAYSEAIVVLNESGKTIASYNHKAYESMVEAFSENTLKSATYIPESEAEGHDGALEVAISKAGAGAVVLFNLILPEELDLTTNTNGLKIRIRVKETTATPVNSVPITTLNLYYAKPTFTANQEFSVRDSSDNGFSLGTMTVGGEWVELTITNTQLTSYAYANTDGKATVSLGVGYSGQNMRNGTTVIQIDYIEYV